jgi:hypothetical protein
MADDFIDAVRGEVNTELSRLGSSKSLYADTRGEMDEGPILQAIADYYHAAADTLDSWADESDGEAGALFADAAETTREIGETVADEHGDYEQGEPPAAGEYLSGLDGDLARVGGLVGWALVADNKTSQAVGFFVGQASPGTASTFRSLGDEVDDLTGRALDALAALCESEDDRETARDAAVGVIEAAYDEYFETLEELGVNPKPVC